MSEDLDRMEFDRLNDQLVTQLADEEVERLIELGERLNLPLRFAQSGQRPDVREHWHVGRLVIDDRGTAFEFDGLGVERFVVGDDVRWEDLAHQPITRPTNALKMICMALLRIDQETTTVVKIAYENRPEFTVDS